MSENPSLRRVLKAVLVTVKAHRALRAAREAKEEVRVKCRKALSAALVELDAAATAFTPPAKASPSFDWTGAGKAVAAGLELLQKVKGAKTQKDVREVFEIIDAEIIE